MAKSFWDEFKDLFKTDSQRAEEKQNQINNALEQEKALTEQLAALEKEYNDSLPKEEEIDFEKLFPISTGLKEIEYALDSDEDIAERAKTENALGKQQATNALQNKYGSQAEVLEESKKNASENLKEGYAQLQELYDQLRKRSENDSIKRGIARSSIATGTLDNLDAARMKGASSLRESYNDTVNNIDGNIAKLEADLDNALEELDIKYAVELKNRIAELQNERDKKAKEYEEYNAKVRKQNSENERKREEDIADYLKKREKEKADAEEEQAKYESKYGYTGAKQENYAKRYDAAYEFYSSLAPEIAADALEASPNMKYYLGAYYDTLLNALSGRSEGQTRVY